MWFWVVICFLSINARPHKLSKEKRRLKILVIVNNYYIHLYML
jgi:hypothetical protein